MQKINLLQRINGWGFMTHCFVLVFVKSIKALKRVPWRDCFLCDLQSIKFDSGTTKWISVSEYSRPLFGATITRNLLSWVLKKKNFILSGKRWHLISEYKQWKFPSFSKWLEQALSVYSQGNQFVMNWKCF